MLVWTLKFNFSDLGLLQAWKKHSTSSHGVVKCFSLKLTHLLTVIILSPSYNGSVLTRYQPMCQEHQVSTSACSPDPRLPLHPSFPTKLLDEHLLWTHSNESDQAVESLCLAKLLQSDDSVVLLLCSHHCSWDQTTSQAVQVWGSYLHRKGRRGRSWETTQYMLTKNLKEITRLWIWF